jgi:hypothetical protein
MSVRGAMQGAGGERATRSYPQHCLGATGIKKILSFACVDAVVYKYCIPYLIILIVTGIKTWHLTDTDFEKINIFPRIPWVSWRSVDNFVETFDACTAGDRRNRTLSVAA